MKMLMMAEFTMPAGIAAARDSGECQMRNMRLMKPCSDHEPVESTSGTAIARTCR